ncbi:hypothetical protein CTEN210_09825 [Chaetoceros tenuissimus]|uniref:Alkaline phosphatase n=1 Tax=Chaetoceros tenuissimus TaxID=426638 RepID=A0AAD3CWV7_9STRA|nr:hypothetical protein CTEN210_09825 [Chaetoceros tenuissimus]
MNFLIKSITISTLLVSNSYAEMETKSNAMRLLRDDKKAKASKSKGYEIWAPDQSNSVVGEGTLGNKGSYLWIWDSKDMVDVHSEPTPLSCTPIKAQGPCDIFDIFPLALDEYDADGVKTGQTLQDLNGFGRFHGALKDPSNNRYINVNMFTPKGGYVGVMDTTTKEAIGLFRVAATSGTNSERSVHMSFWAVDGSAIIIANLHGKMVERIDVTRNSDGEITDLSFNRSASVYLGKDFSLKAEPTYFLGHNAFGRPLIGSIVGSYDDADTGDLTPALACKEVGCTDANAVATEGGERTNNVPVCPIPSMNSNVYVTMGGGGLLVLKSTETPMQIVGEYGDAIVNGAGCAGTQSQNQVFLNAGVSASGAGSDQSTFTLYTLDDTLYSGPSTMQNYPPAQQVFKDPTNTNTNGNVDGVADQNPSGQIPQYTTRRDSHGAVNTIDGKYVHVADRIKNVVEVFDTETYEHVSTYDLVSMDGQSGRSGPSGACRIKSVTDDAGLVLNDPAPDLMDITPDGKYIVMGFRGPAPVTVGHAAQGSCPGVGIVEVTKGGKSGKLVNVLRASNVTPDSVGITVTGGHDYIGKERSDVHQVTVISKK